MISQKRSYWLSIMALGACLIWSRLIVMHPTFFFISNFLKTKYKQFVHSGVKSISQSRPKMGPNINYVQTGLDIWLFDGITRSKVGNYPGNEKDIVATLSCDL